MPPLPEPEPEITQKLPFKRARINTLQRGALISCKYAFYKHDPSPLVLVTDVFAQYIRGINLHYLTVRYMRSLLDHYCGKPQFSYELIRGDKYIVSAFRTYKRNGIRNIQLLDCDSILKVLGERRTKPFNPQEMKEIVKQIRQQLRQQINPTADDLTKKYAEMLGRQSGFTTPPGQITDNRRVFRPAITPTVPTVANAPEVKRIM